MPSQLELYNQALTQAMARTTLTDITENKPGANTCNLFYETVRQNVLKTASWPSTRKFARLPLLVERNFTNDWADTDPSPGWRYAYGLPTDMLAPRYLHSYMPFEVEYFPSQGVMAIMTNATSPILHYTFDQKNVAMWDPALYRAIMFALSAHITLPLNGKPGLAQYLNQQALDIIVQAQTDVANQDEHYEEALPEAVEVRGYGESPVRTKFMFPYETLNGVSA
jgi:hypothetical protein